MLLALLLATVLVLASCSAGGGIAKTPPPTPEPVAEKAPEPVEQPGGETRVEMVNIMIHLDPTLLLHIRRLSGKLLRAHKNQAPTFDDKQSYIIDVDSAEIAIGMASMTHMMNAYVFGDADA